MADSQLTSPESKCPLLSVDSSTQENDPSALSKSKKKRLRKKKKIEEEATEKKKKEVEGTSVDTPQSVDTSTIKFSSKSGLQNQSVSISEKGHEPPVTVSSPVIPKSIESPSVSVKCNNKSKEYISQSNSETVKTSTADSAPGAGSKVESCASRETRGQPPKMDSKPAKDDVMAQREAKKLAKLAKKKKSGSDSVATSGKAVSSNEPTKENVSHTLNATPSKAQSTASVPVKTIVVTQSVNNAQRGESPVKAASVVTAANNQITTVEKDPPQPPSEPRKTEKTREEIMAEREAKKQAKLAAKNKKKVPGQPGDPPPAAPLTKDNSDKTEIRSGSAVSVISSANDKPGSNKENTESEAASEKSKAQLRAERRAKQEAQRAAKEADKAKPSAGSSIKSEIVKEKMSTSSKAAGKTVSQSAKPAKSVSYQPKLLSHLQMDSRPLPTHIYQNVHPAIVELGAKYAARVVAGSNARCVALLQALKKVIADFVTPREKEFSRAIESRLNDSMAFLNASRLSSVSMTNALKHVKSHLTQLTTEKATTDDEVRSSTTLNQTSGPGIEPTTGDFLTPSLQQALDHLTPSLQQVLDHFYYESKARRKLFEVIDTFIKEQIDVAGEAICNAIAKKISNGDTIAIYGCSSLLLRILVESRSEGKDFEVVIVDGGPLYEGREMCRRLVAENIRCTYVLLPAFSYIVGQTTKVLLGAHALLANGCVMSRSGTALVAMLAKAHNVPVIVCCETYKFCERVQADAFVYNELGPQHGSGSPPLISLMYDMTPPTLVDAVATELAILPCTSVPVILRVKPSDVSSYYY